MMKSQLASFFSLHLFLFLFLFLFLSLALTFPNPNMTFASTDSTSFTQCGLVDAPTEEALINGGSCHDLPLHSSPSPVYLLEMFNFDFSVNWSCERPSESLVQLAQEEWKQKYTLWVKSINSAYLPIISRWAKEEMKNYHYKPEKEAPALRFYGCVKDKVLYEATLATLPTHHPLVVRYLKMFILTHKDRPLTESSLIITIHGERFE